MRWAHQTQMPYGRMSPFCSTKLPSRTSFTMLCRADPYLTPIPTVGVPAFMSARQSPRTGASQGDRKHVVPAWRIP